MIEEAKVTQISFDGSGRPYAADFVKDGVSSRGSFDYLVDASGARAYCPRSI